MYRSMQTMKLQKGNKRYTGSTLDCWCIPAIALTSGINSPYCLHWGAIATNLQQLPSGEEDTGKSSMSKKDQKGK